MRTAKQTIYNTCFTRIENSSFSSAHKTYASTEDKDAIQLTKDLHQPAPLQWVKNSLRKTMHVLYRIFAGSLTKLIAADQNGKSVLVDMLSPEGSFFPRYSFLGTPHVLYMVPMHSTTSHSTSFPFTINVKAMEENCYELVIEGSKKSNEALGINIYDESNSLVFSEQITCQGRYSRLYDLKWPQLTTVTFELISKYGTRRTKIV